MAETSTLPRALRAALATGTPKTLRALSSELGVPEKSLPDALGKLERSLRREGYRIEREPAACLACAFTFRERERYSSPGRCPCCRSERIAPAKFWLMLPRQG